MTVTSLTFTIVNTYAPQNAKPAPAVERKTPPVQADDPDRANERPESRQNRFADAMMSALRALGFGGTAAPAAAAPAATPVTPAASTTSATPVTTTQAPAPTAPATAGAAGSSASVESAVQQFAHALFQALRQSGTGHGKTDDADGSVKGHGHQPHHRHHHHHGEGSGYGNLSQRLEALSQTLGTPAVAAVAPANTAAPTNPSLALAQTVADAPAVVASATPTVATGAATIIAGPVAAPAKNLLLDAFTTLFNTLKPATTGAPATDMAEKLRLFLHTLAQAVAPDTMGSVQRAQVGGLVNVTA